MFHAGARVEEIDAPDQVLELAHAELGHPLAHFLGDEEEIVDDVLGLAFEFLDELRILRRDADRAGVQMAFAHHDAALHHERRRGEAELVGAEERADHDVAPGLHLPVGLHGDAPTQLVQHQRLLRFREADLPGAAGVLATVPTPISLTSFTETRAAGFTFFRSWISCARSSIE